MFLILLAALLLRNFNILNNNQQPCQPSPSQRSEGGQGVVVDNGHSSFAADTIHSEGAVTAGLWFVLTWSIYHIKVKMKTVYGEDLQETSRCQSADQTCNWCLTRPRLFILSHIIHSLGSHNYNIIRQFKSQFINYTLHNAQRMALLQHLSLSDRACLVYSSKGNGCSRIWVFYWRVESWDLVRARSLPICWLPLSLCRQLRCSGYLGRPGPSRARSQPPAGTCNGEPPGKLKYFLRWKYFQPFFGHQCYISVSF